MFLGKPASGGTMQQSMFQARCQETILISDWGVPLIIALLLLWLIYAFIYLPAMVQKALMEEVLGNVTDNYARDESTKER
ncbi:UNVERIFIED_CONTAM: hypothetical protein FKN15_030020 [Acipenser sinensis]